MEIQFNARLQKELTIHDIQVAMEAGQLTSKELVMYYLHRIAKYDQEGPKINSILEINPDAIFIAEALDYERKTKVDGDHYMVYLFYLRTILKRMTLCIQVQVRLPWNKI
ncbi:Hypothetical protein BCRIVMBC120_02204 [Bacillus wiedmannii]|nr:Hypothetical protein BCRIVMBC120_02204 [Bacillus wiedmannii]